MQALELKVPPPLAGLACGVGMYGLARLLDPALVVLAAPGATPGLPATLRWLAIVLAAAGLAFDARSVLDFVRARTTINPLKPASSSALVTSGLYRVTRNPMYVGMALLLLAWTAWLGTPWALLGVAAFVAWITRLQIIPEERALAQRFGAEFEAYRQRVRRWI